MNDSRPYHEVANHLATERRYADQCWDGLQHDPEYYRPQLIATQTVIERLETELHEQTPKG